MTTLIEEKLKLLKEHHVDAWIDNAGHLRGIDVFTAYDKFSEDEGHQWVAFEETIDMTDWSTEDIRIWLGY